MSLLIKKYSDLSGPLYFYNNTVKLRFSPKHWLYLREHDDGTLEPVSGVTGVLKVAVDKSQALIGWATRLFLEKAIAMVQECRRGDFVEIEYNDLVAILTEARNEHKNVLDLAGATGHASHAFVESLVKATLADDENRRLEVLSKFPEDSRATNAAVACLAFMAEHNVRYLDAERRVFSKEFNCAGTMDGDVLLDSCDDPECPCQAHAPFINKRMVLDLKTSNNLQETYLGQCHLYWKARVEEKIFEGDPITYDGVCILRLGKDDQSEFEPFFDMGDERHEKGVLFFKHALDLVTSLKDATEAMKAVKDARREKLRIAKEAAQRVRCPKADIYKGTRKSKCFDDGTQCLACAKLFIDKNSTKVL